MACKVAVLLVQLIAITDIFTIDSGPVGPCGPVSPCDPGVPIIDLEKVNNFVNVLEFAVIVNVIDTLSYVVAVPPNDAPDAIFNTREPLAEVVPAVLDDCVIPEGSEEYEIVAAILVFPLYAVNGIVTVDVDVVFLSVPHATVCESDPTQILIASSPRSPRDAYQY